MKKHKLAYLYDDAFLNHRTPEYHPESPQRLLAIDQSVKRLDFYEEMLQLSPRPALPEELHLVHDPAYVAKVKRECEAGKPMLSTGDTDICAGSYDAALQASGGVLNAVDAVMTGKAGRAFCAVRPPGHHAGPARGMGFCIFNNVGVAARYAQKKHGVKRVLIADWDVHHGNGTQEIFYGDGTVLYFSTHQSPHYPGTGAPQELGEGAGKGLNINCPFPWGTGNREIIAAFREILLPVAREFQPEFTLISAGFDSRVHDPLGGFEVDDDGFRELTRIMIGIAAIAGQGRLVSVLEGGYNLSGLSAAVCAHLDELNSFG